MLCCYGDSAIPFLFLCLSNSSLCSLTMNVLSSPFYIKTSAYSWLLLPCHFCLTSSISLSFCCCLPFIFLSLYVSLNFPKKCLVGLVQCLIEFPQEVFGWFGSEQRILSRESSPLALTHYVTYCDWGHTIPSIAAYI